MRTLDAADGTIAHRRTLVAFPSQDGSPDGMAIDRDGFLWVALWGLLAGSVFRCRPGVAGLPPATFAG